MIKLGLNVGIFNGKKSLEEVAKFASKLGYQTLEIPATKNSSFLDIESILNNGSKSVIEIVKKYGLDISALSNHTEGQLVLGPLDESTDRWSPVKKAKEKVKFGMKRMKETAQVASELEVPVVTGFVGSSVWGKWYNMPEENERIYEKAWEIFRERWNEILDVFANCGVKFALEVHPVQIAYNIETAEKAIEVLDNRPEFGFNFDPSHFVWQFIDPVIFIKKFGERIYYSHAKDGELQVDELPRSGVICSGSWDRVDRGFRFRVPGWGDINWRRIISTLVEVGYDYVLSYEHEDPIIALEDGCRKCIQYLKPLIIKRNN